MPRRATQARGTKAQLTATSVSVPCGTLDMVGRVRAAIALSTHLELTGLATAVWPAIIPQPPFGHCELEGVPRSLALRLWLEEAHLSRRSNSVGG